MRCLVCPKKYKTEGRKGIGIKNRNSVIEEGGCQEGFGLKILRIGKETLIHSVTNSIAPTLLIEGVSGVRHQHMRLHSIMSFS